MSYSRRSRYSRSPSPYDRDVRSPSRSPARSRSCNSSDAENPGNNLYVTGLSTRVSMKEVEKHFSAEGKVDDVRLVVDPWSKESRGFGFVTMSSVQEADACIKYLDGSVLAGRVITVEKSRRRRGRTSTPGRYLGLKTGRGRHQSRGYLRNPSPSYSSGRGRSRSRSYSPYHGRGRSFSRSRSCSRSPVRDRSYSPYYYRPRSRDDDYRKHQYRSRSRSPRYRRSYSRSITPRASRRSYSRSKSPVYYRRSYSRSISPPGRKGNAPSSISKDRISGNSRSSKTQSRSPSPDSASQSY